MKNKCFIGFGILLIFLAFAKVLPNVYLNIGALGLFFSIGFFIFSLFKRKRGRLKLAGIMALSALAISVAGSAFAGNADQRQSATPNNLITQVSTKKSSEVVATEASVEKAQKAEEKRLAKEAEVKKREKVVLAETAKKKEAEKQAQAEKEAAAAKKAEAEKAAAAKEAAAKAEEQRIATEKAEAERVAAEEAAAEKAAQEKAAQEKAEADRLAAERAEAERVAAEQAEAERLAAEQAEAERIAAEEQAQASGEVVYVAPESGRKYHYSPGCRGLSQANSVVDMTVDQAKSNGYTICGWED